MESDACRRLRKLLQTDAPASPVLGSRYSVGGGAVSTPTGSSSSSQQYQDRTKDLLPSVRSLQTMLKEREAAPLRFSVDQENYTNNNTNNNHNASFSRNVHFEPSSSSVSKVTTPTVPTPTPTPVPDYKADLQSMKDELVGIFSSIREEIKFDLQHNAERTEAAVAAAEKHAEDAKAAASQASSLSREIEQRLKKVEDSMAAETNELRKEMKEVMVAVASLKNIRNEAAERDSSFTSALAAANRSLSPASAVRLPVPPSPSPFKPSSSSSSKVEELASATIAAASFLSAATAAASRFPPPRSGNLSPPPSYLTSRLSAGNVNHGTNTLNISSISPRRSTMTGGAGGSPVEKSVLNTSSNSSQPLDLASLSDLRARLNARLANLESPMTSKPPPAAASTPRESTTARRSTMSSSSSSAAAAVESSRPLSAQRRSQSPFRATTEKFKDMQALLAELKQKKTEAS